MPETVHERNNYALNIEYNRIRKHDERNVNGSTQRGNEIEFDILVENDCIMVYFCLFHIHHRMRDIITIRSHFIQRIRNKSLNTIHCYYY